ncbi:MAG TPA: TIGR03960 family B12-binding radical SAM protein [Kofleriaceae bacterium]|nr:TIGR03960 family B12-binding radical SAM protein [Kofleriaceae bacterium]
MRHIYADFIDKVTKPARYLGGEYQSVQKDHATVAATVCLGFPDVYDIGMSHLGTKILYSLLNKDPRIACERVFAPWTDMEAELRERKLPLVALESQLPLRDFDVLGLSLQYELTFTNMLTLLDLGGIALRTADRAEDATLVLVGGPTASHPEPVAAFIDAAFIGEAEETLPALVVEWAAMRKQIRAGERSRRDALAELASRYPLYVPSLYNVDIDEATGMHVVGAPTDPRAPARISRAMLANLDAFPFPSDAPVPYAEAVFERASVEIARGCTEGCRFCQAGMIYRPVRERSSESITKSLLDGVDRAGYEETGLTCLSTADFSSIAPLIKSVAGQLRQRGVSMSVASLRAYGLGEALLDELAMTRISGLTFAPEAGTQRMRDVVNKNITEAHVEESARRVFERGWHRLKLYFMIGLPTEEDEDVAGVVATGARMLRVGRQYVGKRAEVTVSVSSHVPKPHTPFQWCAQDTHDEIVRKQGILREVARAGRDPGLRLKHHDAGISFVEGILARGDRRIADVIETVWRDGARFDGWEECFDIDRWHAALAQHNVDVPSYMGTRPIAARLPWDHIDVGLEEGFLLSEYRKALKGRASPPCGKVAGMLVHHTNLADAVPDQRKLVCYDCGVACDLAKMREDRLVALRVLGANERPALSARAEADAAAAAAHAASLVDVSERGGGSPAETTPVHDVAASRKRIAEMEASRAERVRAAGLKDAGPKYATYRLRMAKVGRAAFLGHLDFLRLLGRSFRRADLAISQTRGFSPKPRVSFGPALGLGVPSLGELVDIDVDHMPLIDGVFVPSYLAPGDAPCAELPAAAVFERLAAVLPPGIALQECQIVRLAGHPLATGQPDQGLGKLIKAVEIGLSPAPDGMLYDAARLQRLADAFLQKTSIVIERGERTVDVRSMVSEVSVIDGDAAMALRAALDWPSDRVVPLIRARVSATADGSVKPSELAKALSIWGNDDLRAEHALMARLGVVTNDEARWNQHAPLHVAAMSEQPSA